MYVCMYVYTYIHIYIYIGIDIDLHILPLYLLYWDYHSAALDQGVAESLAKN